MEKSERLEMAESTKKMLLEKPPNTVRLVVSLGGIKKTWKAASKYLETKYGLDIGIDSENTDTFEKLYDGPDLRNEVGFLWGESNIPEDDGPNPEFGDNSLEIVFNRSLPKYNKDLWKRIVNDATAYIDEKEDEIDLKPNLATKETKVAGPLSEELAHKSFKVDGTYQDFKRLKVAADADTAHAMIMAWKAKQRKEETGLEWKVILKVHKHPSGKAIIYAKGGGKDVKKVNLVKPRVKNASEYKAESRGFTLTMTPTFKELGDKQIVVYHDLQSAYINPGDWTDTHIVGTVEADTPKTEAEFTATIKKQIAKLEPEYQKMIAKIHIDE